MAEKLTASNITVESGQRLNDAGRIERIKIVRYTASDGSKQDFEVAEHEFKPERVAELIQNDLNTLQAIKDQFE